MTTRRFSVILTSVSCLALAACGGGGGGGVESLGSVTPPKVDVGTLTPSPTPTPTASTNFLDVTASTDYTVLGGFQSLSINEKGGQLYRGNANTAASQTSKINYSPRDGLFTLIIAEPAAGAARNVTYQDPAHRTVSSLDLEIPRISGFNYLSTADGDADTVFFYQRPGATGVQYVSLAGYAHTEVDKTTGKSLSERGAFVFGTRTASMQVPISGSGTYQGNFLASMVGTKFNEGGTISPFQWMVGTSSVTVDFGAATVGLALNGQVLDAAVKNDPVSNAALNIPGGSTFAATGNAKIDYLRKSGFAGSFSRAEFTVNGRVVPVDFSSVSAGSNVAGASSIDGTFYGPNAVNVGGSFRITGGTPDQRVDILGGFAGAK